MNKKNFYVLNTRPSHQANHLSKLILQSGGYVYELPLIDISPISFNEINPSHFDYFIFLSKNAVDYFTQKINPSAPIIAVGDATKQALLHLGYSHISVPKKFGSEGILDLSEMKTINGKSIAIICGKNPKPLLQKKLTDRGAKVYSLFCYERRMIEYDPTYLFQLLISQKINWIVITNKDSFLHLIHLLHTPSIFEFLKKIPLCVVSENLKKMAEKVGFMYVQVTKNPIDEEIVAAMYNADYGSVLIDSGK